MGKENPQDLSARSICASDQSWSGRRGYACLGDVRSPVDAKPDEAAEGETGCGRALSPPRGDSPSRTEPGHRIVGWGTSRGIHPLQALRAHKVVSLVPVAPSSPECAACPFTSPDNRLRQAEFVGQRCGQRDDADHNTAGVSAKRGITQLLSGDPPTKSPKRPRIFRKPGPERSAVTPGEDRIRRGTPEALAPWPMSQEPPGAIRETPASA